MSQPFGSQIESIDCPNLTVPESVYGSDKPMVLRGLVSEWPLVKSALDSDQAAVDYLNQFYNQAPVTAFMAAPEAQGRIFYNEQVNGFNFVQSNVYLDDVLNKIIEISGVDAAATYYLGSMEIPLSLPGFLNVNDINIKSHNVRKSIWLGNQSLVAPHYDFPDNIACCVIGKRRFTLFPPEQLENLYVGPLDLTPAGQAISMVNIKAPELDTYPKFAQAMDAAFTAELYPGDAIYIPSMWWHAVESLSALNGLVNYWWRDTPDYLGSPENVLLHALLSIKSLPERQRRAWQKILNHYVFEPADDIYDHLPDDIKSVQGNINDMTARKIRAQLQNKLR